MPPSQFDLAHGTRPCFAFANGAALGTTFLARSLREAGYSVWANAEASGTTTPMIRDISNDMMRDAGVNVVSLFYIVCDLMRDWRNTPGADKVRFLRLPPFCSSSRERGQSDEKHQG